MSKRARELSSHLEVFNNRLLTFLKDLDQSQHSKVLPWEGFSVLTVAGHISGPRHYGLREMASRFVNGESIPDITKEMVVDLANRDFESHKYWTLDDVMDSLKEEARITIAYISSLTDENLGAVGHLESFGGDISVDQLIDWIIIGTSVEHLENMKRVIF